MVTSAKAGAERTGPIVISVPAQALVSSQLRTERGHIWSVRNAGKYELAHDNSSQQQYHFCFILGRFVENYFFASASLFVKNDGTDQFVSGK